MGSVTTKDFFLVAGFQEGDLLTNDVQLFLQGGSLGLCSCCTRETRAPQQPIGTEGVVDLFDQWINIPIWIFL